MFLLKDIFHGNYFYKRMISNYALIKIKQIYQIIGLNIKN